MDFFASRPLTPENLGLLRGIGIFEFFRTYHLKPFLLDRRVERLRSSAKKLGLPFSYSNEQVEKIVTELIGDEECTIRLLLTGEEKGESTFFVLTYPLPPKEKPTKLKTFQHLRYLPEIKSTNYLSSVMAGQTLGDFNDALYISGDHILEARHANFFGVKEGKLITPNQDILPGITRGVVIDQLAKEIPVEQRPIHVEEIPTFEEAFITGSIREIVPVIAINEHRMIPSKTTQEITSRWKILTGQSVG